MTNPRFRLNPRYRLFVVAEANALILLDELASVIVEGAAVVQMAALFPEMPTLSQVVAAMQGTITLERTVEILTHLIQDAILELI